MKNTIKKEHVQSGGKNAISPFGRKRIFAEIGATTFQKHFQALAFDVFEKRLRRYWLIRSF